MSRYDNMVEDMEAREDMVECKECFDLFPKTSCMKYPQGYICPTCGKSREVTATDITTDLYSHDFPDVADYDPDSVRPVYTHGADEMFDALIADEVEAIDAYDRALKKPYPKKTLKTLDHIRDEEEEHIEELEDLKDKDLDEGVSLADVATAAGTKYGTEYTERDILDRAGVEDMDTFADIETFTDVCTDERRRRSRFRRNANNINEIFTEAATTFKYNDSEEPGAADASKKTGDTTEDEVDGESKTEGLQEACTWTCRFEGKDIGTVEAASEEEAIEKMQKEYPEYPYGKYDGCFEVCKEDLNEAALNEYVIDRTAKRVGAGIKRGLEWLQGKDAAKILNSFFTKGFFIYVMEHDDFKLSDMEKSHRELHNKPSNPFKDYTKAFTTAGRISKLYETKVFLFANVLTQDAIAKSEFGKTLATRYGSKATEIDDGEDVGKTMPGIQLAVFEDGRALLNPGNKLATNLATARDEKKALDKSAKKATKGGSGTARNYGKGPEEKKKTSRPKDPPPQEMITALEETKKFKPEQLEYLKTVLDPDLNRTSDKWKAAYKALSGLYRSYMLCKDDPDRLSQYMSSVSELPTDENTMGQEAAKIASEVEQKFGMEPQGVNASYYDELPEDEDFFLTEAAEQGNYQVDHKDMKTPDEWFDSLEDAVDYINQGIKDKKAKSFALYDRTNGRNLMIWIDAMKEDRDGKDEFLGYFVSQHEDQSLSFAKGVLSVSEVNLLDKCNEFKKLLSPGVDRYAKNYTWKKSETGHTYVDERELIVYYEPSESEAETKKAFATAWARHPANRNRR